MRKANEFQEWLLAHHPRVSYLKGARQCDALKGLSGTRPCRAIAHWKYTALKRADFSTSGVYCYQHLWYREIFGEMTEMEATERLMVSTGYATPEQTLTQKERVR